MNRASRIGSGARRPVAKRAARREQLIEAALTAIRRDGPGVSMQAIAAEAGVSKPILYRHFGDRGGLVAELATRFTNELMARLRHALTQHTEPRLVLAATIDAYVEAIEQDPNVYQFLVNRALGDDQQAGQRLLDLIEQISREVAVVLGEQLRVAGADSGAAEPWAFGLVGLVHAAGNWWLTTRTMPRERLVEYLVTLAWDGIATSGVAAPTTAISRPSVSRGSLPQANDLRQGTLVSNLAHRRPRYDPAANLCPVTPSLSINDVSLNEGAGSTTTFTFAVSLSSPAGAGGVTFDIATADGTGGSPATQPSDYTAKSLTGQSIAQGSSSTSFNVLVNGDTTVEPNETFTVNITNVTGVYVLDGQGQGTIVNDDTACRPGYFSATGTEPCTIAPAGSYVDTAGASSATDCATGSYQSLTGQTSCVLAPIGSYVDVTGASAAMACPAGTTTLAVGASALSDCVVVQQSQTITFAPLANTLYGAAPFGISASATSGLAVSFGSLTTGVCTVSGATVTILTAGVCTIHATQAGNGSWLAATPVDRSFTVGYGISQLSPPAKTSFTRRSTLPVKFQLTGANGNPIPANVAASLGCTVKVTFNAGTPVCATYDATAELFQADIKTPSNLTKGQNYQIVITVTVGTTIVATATVNVVAK